MQIDTVNIYKSFPKSAFYWFRTYTRSKPETKEMANSINTFPRPTFVSALNKST